MSGKPRASFQVVKNTLCLKGMHKFLLHYRTSLLLGRKKKEIMSIVVVYIEQKHIIILCMELYFTVMIIVLNYGCLLDYKYNVV